MPRTVCFAVVLFIPLATLFALYGAADEKPPTTEALIEQLGSDKFAERERAVDLLKARGPGILPTLRKASEHRDEEIRRRVKDLIAILENTAALEPTRVTLKVKPQPLSVTVAEIARQTGYDLSLEKTADRDCAFDIKGVPFWEALERIRRETNLVVNVHPLEEGISLHPGELRMALVAVNGPFRVQALRFHEDRDIHFLEVGKDKESPRRDNQLKLTLSVLAEPKFILLGVDKARVEVALDENNQSLKRTPVLEEPKPNPTRLDLGDALARQQVGEDHLNWVEILRRPFQHQTEVILQRATEAGKRIKVLRGTIPVQVMVARKPVVVTENFLKSTVTKCQIGGHVLEVTCAKLTDKSIEVRIAVPKPQQGLKQFWHQRIHLQDAKGNPYNSNGSGNSISNGQHEIMVRYPESTDPKLGPPAKLVIEDWTVLDHAIPFEFKDLPLP